MKDDKEWQEEWNELHCKYTAEQMKNAIKGISDCGKFRTFKPQPEMVDHRNNKMADYIEEIIVKAKNTYYAGEPIMSDQYYDKLENILRLLRPDSKMLEKIGHDIK